VGHRALVAYERADGWDCHHSQWGAAGLRLAEELTPATPFGRPPTDPPVEPAPRRRADSFDAVRNGFDHLEYETLYVVTETFAVRASLSVWLGVETRATDDREPTDGLFVPVSHPADATAVRRRVRSLKAALGRTVERGLLDPADARTRLERAVRAVAAGRESPR
jgi:hypothetical protein